MADDRTKAIETALSQLEKQFGKGSIMRLGAKEAIVPISECLQRLRAVGRIREGPGVAFLQVDPQLRSRGDRPDLHLASGVRVTR